ncbi:hypothetical protein ACGFI3_31730 [Nonomuraea wenchangensis]|uniref:hypothetical protein n=1 Tax=Nonomuraea wenchangensis TaxID=568860 RepID=UPI003721C821
MTKTSDPAPSLNDLKARLLAGDDTVTAEQLARAAEVQQWEDLRRQAAELKAAEEAEADRLDAVRAIKARVLAAESLDDDQADMRAITEAAARIITRHGNRAQAVRDAIRDLAKQRVHDGGDPIEGIRWNNAGMGRPEGVTVDGRHLSASSYPGAVIADAILQALTDAGVRRQVITPHVQLIPSNRRR